MSQLFVVIQTLMGAPKSKKKLNKNKKNYKFRVYKWFPLKVILGHVIEMYFWQFKLHTGLLLLLEFCIIYNIFQLLKQQQIVFILAYKLLILIYMGWIFLYFNLDIFAFILWIVYGSFIIMVFVFSLMWKSVNYNTKFIQKSQLIIINIYFIVIYTIFYNSLFLNNFITFNLWQLNWINYYEFLILNIEEEIVILGAALAFENLFNLVLLSIFLTFCCLTAVLLFINARQYITWAINSILQFNNYFAKNYKFIFLKTQNTYLQEVYTVNLETSPYNLFHFRRI